MSGLSRDILKWIQSLDLSYAIKNVRRDFSNGFLIAEILSRYYRSEITMHSYDHGTGVNKKSLNWTLLEKFFHKQGWPIDKQTIQGVIHCDQGSAITLIEQLYTILTHKPVPTLHALRPVEYIPPYAQPTTNQLIRERLKKSDMNEDEKPQDLHSTIVTTQRVITEHNLALRMDKATDPTRYQPNEKKKEKKEKTISLKPQATLKQVTVKQADIPISTSSATTLTQAMNQLNMNTTIPKGNKKTCSELMDSVVAARLEGNELRQKLDPRLPLSIAFTDHILSFPDDLVSDIFCDILTQHVQEMSSICLADPKEFWKITGIWWKAVISLPASSLAFREILYLISSLGSSMLEHDITTPFQLLSDFLISRIVEVISTQSEKLAPIISMLYAYVMDDIDEHMRILNVLRDGIKDSGVIIKCYATLLQLENEFNDTNLNRYMQFINIGLQDSSPSIRAVSLSMLASIAVKQRIEGAQIVVEMLDRLTPTTLGSDWIVLAQLCHLLTALLTQPHVTNSPEICTRIYDLLTSILHTNANPLVLRAGLSSLTRCLHIHPKMRHLFVELLTKREDVRQILLQEKREYDPEVDVHCPQIRRLWHPLSVAQAVQEHVKSGTEQNLLPVHMDLLSTTLSSLTSFPSSEISAWMTLFDSLRDEIIVELAGDRCHLAKIILDRYITDEQMQPHTKQLLLPVGDEAPRLYGIMPYIFPNSGPSTQANFLTMLEEWASLPALTPLIARLLSNYARAEPTIVQSHSQFQSLLQRVNV